MITRILNRHLSPSWASVIFAVAANKLIGPNLSEIRLCVLFEGVGDTPAVPEVGQPSYYSGYPSEEEPSDHVLLYADLSRLAMLPAFSAGNDGKGQGKGTAAAIPARLR